MSSEPATSTNPGPTARWVCGLLQAGDTFYPTGSYAHSFGLEGMIQEQVVRDRASLRVFLRESTLPMLEHAELPLLAHAWRALEAQDWERSRVLCVRSSAMKAAQEARLASEKIGRQRVELLAALHPNSIATEFLARATAGDWPHSSAVATALEARVHGAPLDAALAGYSYSALTAVIAAAMKLLRLGQNGAQSLLTECLTEVPAITERAMQTPLENIGWFNPWLDIAAARHETADARMFIS